MRFQPLITPVLVAACIGLPNCTTLSHRDHRRDGPTAADAEKLEPVVLAAESAQPEIIAPSPKATKLAETIADADATAEARLDAARALLDDVDLRANLAERAFDPAARAILLEAGVETPLRALAVLESLPPSMLSDDELVRLIDRASESPTKRAAGMFVRLLDTERSKVTEAASKALARSTGRADLVTAGSWREWWQSHQNIPPDRWTQTLFSELAERAQSLERRQQRLDRLVLDTYRRLYIVTTPQDRSALLAELLESDLPGVRDLGFELADRELSSNAMLDGAVATKAIALLSDPSPATRAAAARLVNRLAPPEAGEPIARALGDETSPAAAEALLAASARWPSPDAIEPVLRWMQNPSTLNAACQAAVALVEHGLLVGDEHHERVREALLPLPAEPAASSLLLLNLVGTESDRHAIAALLSSENARVRQAAADALARRDDSASLLIEKAVREPSLAPLALITLASQDRLRLLEGVSLPQSAWDEAFAQATSARVKAQLARHMLDIFAELSEDRRSELQAAADAAGG
ncbi:MAG: hypothetical protein Kow0022_14370 [Phycisphaerales bacterium]